MVEEIKRLTREYMETQDMELVQKIEQISNDIMEL